MPRKRPSELPTLFERSADEGKQSNVTSLLNRRSYDALMTCACTSLAARADLAIFRNIFSKQICFLVVNRQSFICAKLTKFGLCKEATFAASSFTSSLWSSIISHLLLQFVVQEI